MEQLPTEIKTTYIIAICMVMLFILFIIFVVVVYNRRRLLFAKEKQLQQAESEKKLLQKEIEKQKSLERERERISHDMHDDLGAGISALKMQAQFLKHTFPDNARLQDEIDLMIKTSEDMNHSMREMLWSLHSGNDNLTEFAEYVSEYGEDFFHHAKISFSIQTKNIKPNTSLSAIKRRNLFLCLKEAMNNALKHSDAESVTLSIVQNHALTITLCDDGKGIQVSKATGYGLQTMRQRMEKLQGTFDVLTTEKGTCLQFQVSLD